MTPLQTPPPATAPLPAPPALKQPNQWIRKESDDEIDIPPPVSFPLLMPQRTRAAPAQRDEVLSAPSLQPQSFEFLKFPALKRENHRDASYTGVAISHPIPIRPSECFRGRSPSLQLIIDNELNNIPSDGTTSERNRPQLRIQPLPSSGAETPSHLARRGAEERTYLESQLRAEEQLRRKHQWENEERKARMALEEDEIDSHNEEISALMDKFSGFELNNHEADADRPYRWAPIRNDKRLYRENIARSPPVILQKSFKRSVSAVIADSRGQDDEDACVLFFPDGLPLVEECGEVLSRRNSRCSLDQCHSFDLDSKCTLSPQQDAITEGSTPFGTISCHSTPNSKGESLECQPVLLGGESNCRGSLNKKVMLRPKMKVRPKTPAKSQGGEESGGDVDSSAVPEQIDCYPRLFEDMDCPFSAIPDLETSHLSFDEDEHQEEAAFGEKAGNNESSRLSFHRLDSETTITHKNGAFANNELKLACTSSFDCPSQSTARTTSHTPDNQGWNYSSPEPMHRSQFRAHASIPSPPPTLYQTTPIEPFQLELIKEPLSESNYCTPDHSNCTIRKQLGVRHSGVLDTLPELFLPCLNVKSQQAPVGDDFFLSALEESSGMKKA